MIKDFKELWKERAREKTNTARNTIEYCILKALASKQEDKVAIATHFLRKAFTPITKTSKLANGRVPFDSFELNKLGAYIGKNPVASGKKGYSHILGVPAETFLSEEEIKQYNLVLSAISAESLIRKYSYFFTRQDIFDEYQLVQTAHVALELGSNLDKSQVKDLHFTCCGVNDLSELEHVENVLKSMKADYVVFREPDIGNQKTSIGVAPIQEHKRGLLKNYQLLRFVRP